MEERKLTGTREHMDKVANLVATAMGVARLVGKPKVREKYLGGTEVSLLLLGKVLEEAAQEVEAIIDWDDITPAQSAGEQARLNLLLDVRGAFLSETSPHEPEPDSCGIDARR